jgi:hypothetical protein
MADNVEVQVEEAKYHRDEFIANSEGMFGVKREYVIGALHNRHEQEFTSSEVEKAINEFMTERV